VFPSIKAGFCAREEFRINNVKKGLSQMRLTNRRLTKADGTNMKQTRLVKILAAGAACAAAFGLALAQETSTTTTTAGSTGVSTTSASTLNGSGTITTYTPGSDYITFRTEASAEPVKYYYTKNTTIVDPEGNTVQWSALRPDMPVTYTYTRDGDRLVITKMTLTKPLSYYEKKETTTTTIRP
jgi:hypothetical protein